MAQKAKELQLPFNLSFCIGATWDFTQLTDDLVSQVVKNAVTVDADFYWDFHVPGDLTPGSAQQPAGEQLTAALEEKRALINGISPRFQAVVLEENGGTHSIARALGHARTSNRLQRLGGFIFIDTGANCIQALGRNDNSWDQGQVFYLPNMTWLSPYGWSQVMISSTYQPYTIQLEDNSSWNDTLDVVGVISEAKDIISVRVANFGQNNVNTSFTINGVTASSKTVAVLQMAGPLDGVNPPSAPSQYSPQKSTLQLENTSPVVFNINIVAYSFSTFTINLTP